MDDEIRPDFFVRNENFPFRIFLDEPDLYQGLDILVNALHVARQSPCQSANAYWSMGLKRLDQIPTLRGDGAEEGGTSRECVDYPRFIGQV